MSKPKILIVGCGSVGLVQGYHLSFGAEITYLVRPGRSPAFQPPKKLYDYKNNALNTFDNYRVVESTSEVAGEEFFCVFDTLDGHTARSEGGAKTLRAVGDLICDHPTTFVVYDAVGLDIDQHYASAMAMPKERMFFAASMLAHQPSKNISVPETADASLVVQADMLYSYVQDNRGLLLFQSQPKLAKAFASIYDKNPALRVKIMPRFVGPPVLLLAILQQVAWSLDGYHSFPQFRSNKELWDLMVKAQTEVLTLPRFGWTGWLSSWVVGSWVTTKIMASQDDDSLPMKVHEFNAFHHGGKVLKQDVQLLWHMLAEGEKAGHKMEALRQVCERGEEVLEKVV